MNPISKSIRYALPAAALFLLAASAMQAQIAVQAQTTGVIQGVIKDDSAQLVSSVRVTAVDPSLGGKSYTSVTGANGSFAIAGVAPGTYSMCVQEPGGAHLDPCMWSTPVQIKVAAGQTVANAAISAVKGAMLQVRVNDPSSLWKAGSGNPDILLGVMLPGSLFQPMHVASTDAAGRTFAVAIPPGTPVKMTVYAPHFAISNSQGLALGATATVAPVQAATAQASLLLTYTITGVK